MNTSLALAIILGQPGKGMKIPMYNADQKNPARVGWVTSQLPEGFTEGAFGSGDITSADGKITVTILKSRVSMPSLQRNPKYMHLPGFTTIRMTNWIGFRNSRPDGEDYKLDWTTYRLNFALFTTDKSKIPTLRSALHTIVDGMDFKLKN